MTRTHSSSELCFAENLWSEVNVCSPAVKIWTSRCRTQDTWKVPNVKKEIFFIQVPLLFVLASDFWLRRLEMLFYPQGRTHFVAELCQTLEVTWSKMNLPNPTFFPYTGFHQSHIYLKMKNKIFDYKVRVWKAISCKVQHLPHRKVFICEYN